MPLTKALADTAEVISDDLREFGEGIRHLGRAMGQMAPVVLATGTLGLATTVSKAARARVRTEAYLATAAACGFQREAAQSALTQAMKEDAQSNTAGDPWAVAMERLLERRSR